MKEYSVPFSLNVSERFSLIKTQGSQFEVVCRPELDCDSNPNAGPCCVANEGLSIRLRVEIDNNPDACSVPVRCEFQSSVPLNCAEVTMTPVGQCGSSCIWDLTCEGLSGNCPPEDTVIALCEAPGT